VNAKGLTTAQTQVTITGGSGLAGVNAKTTSYTAVSGDNNKAIPLNCASACTLTLPTSVPAAPWAIFVSCEGLAACSVVPTSGASLLAANGQNLGTGTLQPGMGVSIWSDSANYHVNQGGVMTGSNVVPILVSGSTNLEHDCGTSQGGTGCRYISPSQNVAPGDALILDLFHSNSTLSAPTDTQGDSFTLENQQTVTASFDFHEYVACGVAGGATTVTFAGDFNIAVIYEVANTATSSCVDGASSAQANPGTSLSTGSITTTAPYDFIFVSGANRIGSANNIYESNGYTNLEFITNDGGLSYSSWYGVAAATGSLSDTLTQLSSSAFYAGILALKPRTTSSTIVPGDLLMAGTTGSLGALHAGVAGTVPTSNGPGLPLTFQAIPTPTNPLSGMTATQVAIAGSANTITGSKPLAGSGPGITTGPITTTNLDCAEFTGTVGQLADAGAPCGSGSGSITFAPPYLYNGTNYFLSNGYQVTKPSGSPTWVNSVTPGSVASGTNGNVVIASAAANTNYFAELSGSASATAALSCMVNGVNASSSKAAFCGVWVYDSTNSKIYTFISNITVTSANVQNTNLLCIIFTYSGSGNPAYSSTAATIGAGNFGFAPGYTLMRLNKSSTTVLAQMSLDGGSTWQTLYTFTGVGTLADGGYYLNDEGLDEIVNVASLVVN
jgi:hypothetical protein